MRPSIMLSLGVLLNVEHIMLWIFIHQFQISCPYESGQPRKVSFFYRQMAGKLPAAPSGPHDCEDVHVRARPIRLSTAYCEVIRPLSILPQSIDQHLNNNCSDHGMTLTQMMAMKIMLAAMEGGKVKRRLVVIWVL